MTLFSTLKKKKNLRIRKYYPSFTDDEFDVAKAIER